VEVERNTSSVAGERRSRDANREDSVRRVRWVWVSPSREPDNSHAAEAQVVGARAGSSTAASTTARPAWSGERRRSEMEGLK